MSDKKSEELSPSSEPLDEQTNKKKEKISLAAVASLLGREAQQGDYRRSLDSSFRGLVEGADLTPLEYGSPGSSSEEVREAPSEEQEEPFPDWGRGEEGADVSDGEKRADVSDGEEGADVSDGEGPFIDEAITVPLASSPEEQEGDAIEESSSFDIDNFVSVANSVEISHQEEQQSAGSVEILEVASPAPDPSAFPMLGAASVSIVQGAPAVVIEPPAAEVIEENEELPTPALNESRETPWLTNEDEDQEQADFWREIEVGARDDDELSELGEWSPKTQQDPTPVELERRAPDTLSQEEREVMIRSVKAKIQVLEMRLDSVASEMQRTLIQDNSVEHILGELKAAHEQLKSLINQGG